MDSVMKSLLSNLINSQVDEEASLKPIYSAMKQDSSYIVVIMCWEDGVSVACIGCRILYKYGTVMSAI